MGIRPAPFIEDPCGCEGFTPETGFVISFSFFAKAIVTRMGEDGLSGFVSLRVKRGAWLAAHSSEDQNALKNDFSYA